MTALRKSLMPAVGRGETLYRSRRIRHRHDHEEPGDA